MATPSPGLTPAGAWLGGGGGALAGGRPRGYAALEGLKVAVALLGSWPLGVPLPLPACHSGSSQQEALSEPYQQVRGQQEAHAQGPITQWREGPRPELGDGENGWEIG